jgi:hypothetical protein
MNLYFDQQHDPNSYFVILVKNGESIKDGGSKSDLADLAQLLKLTIIFQSTFRAHF